MFKGSIASRSIACGVQRFNCFAFNAYGVHGFAFKVQLPAAFKGSIASRSMPAAFNGFAFKGSIACGVQRFNCLAFNCLRRSKVQLPAAFKGSIASRSIACGVQ
jgi:hypothetical protein